MRSKPVLGTRPSSGWGGRAKAVVIDPELEACVWSDSPHVPRILGWESSGGSSDDMKQFLINQAFLAKGKVKPDRPKEAMEKILRLTKRPRSSSIYTQLAEAVSLDRCQDTSFLKFRTTLAAWFPQK